MPFVPGNLYYIWCSFSRPPHEKISICVCGETPYFFWVNSAPRSHGVAQVPLPAGISNGIVHDSVADLSRLKMASANDLVRARDFGPLSAAAAALIVGELQTPVSTLAEAYRQMVLANLT